MRKENEVFVVGRRAGYLGSSNMFCFICSEDESELLHSKPRYSVMT